MSVLDPTVVDFVGVNADNEVELTISDHLEWDEANEHLIILQKKINHYLEAVESGELHLKYPSANNKKINISLLLKFNPNPTGLTFLNSVEEHLNKFDYSFRYKVLL